MGDYQRGDRVRVQIDAEGTVSVAGRGGVAVHVDDVDGAALFVLREYLTPLPPPPPLKLDDEIMVGVDPEPPVGTVLVYVSSGTTMKRWRDGWRFASAETFGAVLWSDCGRHVAHVAWLPPVEVSR